MTDTHPNNDTRDQLAAFLLGILLGLFLWFRLHLGNLFNERLTEAVAAVLIALIGVSLPRLFRLLPSRTTGLVSSAFCGVALSIAGVIVLSLAQSPDAKPEVTPTAIGPTATAWPMLAATAPAPDSISVLGTPESFAAPVAQQLRWGVDLGEEIPGINVDSGGQIAWDALNAEIRGSLLPQLGDVPADADVQPITSGSAVSENVLIVSAVGEELGALWFGSDPARNGQTDGLVRFGSTTRPVRVWATFRRFSDGTYAPLAPWFGEVTFCTGPIDTIRNEACPDSVRIYPSGTTSFYLSWPFNYIPYGAECKRVWYHDGALWHTPFDFTWGDEYENPTGIVNTYFHCPNAGSFPDGEYRVDMYVNDQLIRSASVIVGNR